MKFKSLVILMAAAMFLYAAGNNNEGNNDARSTPRLLNYQGYLTDTLSNPITNPSVAMTFAVYDAVSAGNLKWTEIQGSVGVDKGIFHILLGGVNPIPDSVFKAGADRWLELTIGGQALSPRTRIVSVPYAYTATYSDTAQYARNSILDIDWSFLISDGADTTLQMGGRWGLARVGNTMCGNADSTHVNLGVGSTTGTNGQNYKYATVGGGYGNAAIYNWTTIGGGDRNTAGLSYATVSGGVQNNAGGQCATVGGGSTNIATSECATVAGGNVNTASNYNATVSGGQGNIASGYIATVGGGKVNRARGAYSVVSGGGGGNDADSNSAIGSYSAIGGGYGNIARGNSAVIGGGRQNIASSWYSIVGGGQNNTASNQYSTVGGGEANVASGMRATVAGGSVNQAAGEYSAILGGYADSIAVTGSYSYLFGINSNLTQDSTFMVDMPHVWFGTETNGYEFPYGRGTDGQVMKTNGSGILSWGAIAYVDSARVAANAHKLQGKDTVDFNVDYVNEGQVNSISNTMIQDGAVTTVKLSDTAVTMPKIAPAGATVGQVIKWNGTAWQPSADSSMDNDWSYRITDGADTTLQMGGRWGLARFGNTMYGNVDSTYVNLGVACVTGANGQNYKYITVGGGFQNTASEVYATVSGGSNNTANDHYAFVGGGNNNIAGFVATIGGGWFNTAGNSSTVGGGQLNSATSYGSITGGMGNLASGFFSTISGGGYNRARGQYSVVGGGGVNSNVNPDSNSAIGNYSVIGGGYSNIASGLATVIGGGYNNDNSGDYSVIPGGYADSIAATGDYSYLFGINSNLTQDSTFMVDIPHVWFGTEANGYEFPYSRGTDGQVMKTNGSGILSWGSIAYVDSARIAANAHKLQGKDTVDFNVDYVNEGQVNSITNTMIQDAAVTTAKLSDTAVTMPKIAPAGATVGQVIKWNGTAWQPALDSSMDNDWTYRITDGADTTLQTGGRWGLARFGNTMYGNADSTHVNLGVGSTTGTSGQNNKYCTVGGGQNNTASGNLATVGGGYNNTASGDWYATVGGGYNNTASGDWYATVGGGYNNTASNVWATVVGGQSNTASGPNATVGGGGNNLASNNCATVGGGANNLASNACATVGGGQYNTAADSFNFIGGGYSNLNAGRYSAILGGYADTITATGDYSYLFGINSNLTQDSTFMVDMPHVWFGTEASGYVFPYGRGTNGQALVTNGSGQISWASTNDNDWVINGSNMYAGVSGNVGVGLTSPSAKLDIAGTVKIVDGTQALSRVFTSDANGLGSWQALPSPPVSSVFGRTGAVVAASGDYTTTLVTEGTNLYFTNARAQAAITGGASTITTSNLTANRALLSDGSGKVAVSVATNTELGYLSGVTSAIQTQLSGKAPTASPTFTGNVTMPGTGIWNSSGNVGIGLTTPSAKLDVAGTVKIVDGTQAIGRVFTSDANGLGSWQAIPNDNDWTFRVTDGADTTLQMGGQWGLARYGNLMYGNADSTHINLGVGSTTGTNGQNYKYCTVGGGYQNTASGNRATVSGGISNEAIGSQATVGGGQANTAAGNMSIVGGGLSNYASGLYTTVAGGGINTASGNYATVGGGRVNKARGQFSVVSGGGSATEADSNSAIGDYSAIGGGYHNVVTGTAAVISGGQWNVAGGLYSAIGGGGSNSTPNTYATVGGGVLNTASNDRATVGGGQQNTAAGYMSTVGGGQLNRADYMATVGGGWTNTASGNNSTVGGGWSNTASGSFATISGGQNNTAVDSLSYIGGGNMNSADGKYSAILGGYADTIFATGHYSYLFGINSNLTQDSTFLVDMPHIRFGKESGGYEFPTTDGTNGQALVTNGSGQVSWGSPTDADWTISGNNMYSAVSGNVGIGATSPAVRLEVRAGTSDTAAIFRGNLVIQSKATGIAVLELGEGLDYAEGFDVTQPDKIKPGTVLVIDPKSPGKLAVSCRAYDTKVAGIVAGGKGLGSGVRLGTGDFDHNVALAGRVYCNVDASSAAVEPGDLLTTANTPGYAMKAQNYDRAKGAVLGKAMERLEKGQKGQILVLVSLQ